MTSTASRSRVTAVGTFCAAVGLVGCLAGPLEHRAGDSTVSNAQGHAPLDPSPPLATREMVPARPDLTLSRTTDHLTATASLSDDALVPGGRIVLVANISPKPGMHVYAPGSEYRAVRVVVEPHPALAVRAPSYPEPAVYLFKPLNEEVLVYSEPFSISLEIAAAAAAAGEVPLRGEIEYQACDDSVCYLPTSVPVEWTLRVGP